ncbi:MAG: outer membrane beta-barrel protein [Bacteroidota bacterium]
MSGIKGKLLILLLGFSLSLFSQTPKPPNLVLMDYQQFHFGYSVGINFMSFTVIEKPGYKADLVQYPGLNINLVTNYRLGKNLDIRALPGIQFCQRDLTIEKTDSKISQTWQIESVYVDFPFDLKYRADRVNNYAPYLIVGFCPRLELLGGTLNQWKPGPKMLQLFDAYPELGFGIDFYMQDVKVAAELKFSVSLFNAFRDLSQDPGYSSVATGYANYVYGVEEITSRMVILAIHIE